jgi:hypothetical protein
MTVLLRSEWKQNGHCNGASPQYFEVRPLTLLMRSTEKRGKMAAQNGTASGYGGVVSGASASGAPASARLVANDSMKSIYFGG